MTCDIVELLVNVLDAHIPLVSLIDFHKVLLKTTRILWLTATRII